MSQPRKAMMEMGFQGCCLRCDAKDVANLPRCGNCIDIHRQIRNMIAENDGSSELLQHMSDLFQMLSNPEKYDNDEMHGKGIDKINIIIQELNPRSSIPQNPLTAMKPSAMVKAIVARPKFCFSKSLNSHTFFSCLTGFEWILLLNIFLNSSIVKMLLC